MSGIIIITSISIIIYWALSTRQASPDSVNPGTKYRKWRVLLTPYSTDEKWGIRVLIILSQEVVMVGCRPRPSASRVLACAILATLLILSKKGSYQLLRVKVAAMRQEGGGRAQPFKE